ncbi:unnamed protein product, partial [Timema podura]|nr:unnamed protein product [Timema podura]
MKKLLAFDLLTWLNELEVWTITIEITLVTNFSTVLPTKTIPCITVAGVKLEPCDTENVKIEDTTELLQTEISISKWNPKVDFSNETILGLEVDYLTHDSTNETPSSSVNTPNESELETSCTLFSIKEEPR